MLKFTVNEWVDLFKSIGLSDKQMQQWHQLFEERYPEAHQSFLKWLGLDDDKIKQIRSK